MAEYRVTVNYETNDTGRMVVNFDFDQVDAGLSGQTRESLVNAVASAIADALETLVVNTPNATLGTSVAVRNYAATETLSLA